MELLYVINTLGAGGAERHLLQLASEMVRRGHSVSIAVLARQASGGARNLEADFVAAGIRIAYLRSVGFGEIGRWLSLVSHVGRLRPDVVHSHLPRADLAASVAKFIYPEIIWVSTLHDAYTRDKYAGHWIFPFVKWNWRRADHVVAVSNHVRSWGIQALSIVPAKTTTIYHGVEAACVAAPPDRAPAPRLPRKTIGCLARFEKRKGMETLVRAMPAVIDRFPDAELVLAGSDPTGYSRTIAALARSLGIERNVRILGFRANPFEFLKELDVFALASTSEGFGIVLLEAMSVSCPVVATDIDPINHIVEHRRSGLLVAPENHIAFAEALVELVSCPALARELGSAGRSRCIDEFSLEKALGKMHELYETLLAPIVQCDPAQARLPD